MPTNEWLSSLKSAKKTSIIQDGKRKVHFLLQDGKELVEEYNLDTNVVVRRAWREKGKLGQDIGWTVEVGDPELKKDDNLEISGIRESSSTPFVSRRITRTALEWRVRNLPYPKDVYTVSACDDNTITIKTSNKKYYKKLKVPDLERADIKVEQELISFDHKFNTLIITYKKPAALLQLEKDIFKEIMTVKTVKDGEIQCPTS